MKKILLFLSLIVLVSCSEIGYVATVQVERNGKIDTICVPYKKIQGNTTTMLSPNFELEDGVLSEDMSTILNGVQSFSVIDIKRLKDEDDK